ncbi:MAG TPA: hypothetical protein VGH28_14165 [Polyangiaceae bacterium]
MMTTASVPRSSPAAVMMVSLRTLIDQRLAQGQRFSLDEAIAIIVPLCLDLKQRHDRGELVYVHPSGIAPGPDGLARLQPQMAILPTNPKDRACLAPELQRSLSPGNSRASVFSVGAVLYELVTGGAIGPAMRRPREVDPSLPESLEVLLGKALVGNPAHRPEDLGALASAMHHLAPMKSIPPPDVDTSTLDHTDSFDVDVRLSMLPPSEISGAVQIPQSPAMPNVAPGNGDPFGNVVQAPRSVPRNDPTQRLAHLKERLESDPRPRYVVAKDKMDHGPFSAVELLQQITSNQFSGDHGLRDEISGQSRPIKEWEEFAPFAEQAALKREIVAEKKEVARVVEEEKKAGVAKSAFGIAIVLVLLGFGGFFIYQKVGHRNDGVAINDDKSGFVVDPAGSIKGAHHVQHTGGGGGGGGGGLSFDEAWAHAEQKVTIGGANAGGPDPIDQIRSGVLGGTQAALGECGVPGSMKVTVKAAVQNGRVAGVSVYTTPAGGPTGCIAGHVRGLRLPVSGNMDAVTASF